MASLQHMLCPWRKADRLHRLAAEMPLVQPRAYGHASYQTVCVRRGYVLHLSSTTLKDRQTTVLTSLPGIARQPTGALLERLRWGMRRSKLACVSNRKIVSLVVGLNGQSRVMAEEFSLTSHIDNSMVCSSRAWAGLFAIVRPFDRRYGLVPQAVEVRCPALGSAASGTTIMNQD